MSEVRQDKYGIKHSTMKINGINMHIAEKGRANSPIVLLIHGAPELWFSWRHQIIALADLGYRAVAPDMRGYGGTDAPADSVVYTYCYTAGDMVALIDALGADKVFVVGHDWGALVAWQLCLFRPDKVRALVNLSVAYVPRDPNRKPVESLRAAYGDDYYICRLQVPGEMEAEIKQAGGAEIFLKKVYSYQNSGPLFLPKGEWYKDIPPLPKWLSQQDFMYYVEHFKQTGFTGGFNYYRSLDLDWEITAPWTEAQVKVPTKFIVGDKDLAYHMPGVEQYVSKGEMQKFVPLLKDVVIMKGVHHFIQQEKADEVNKQIHDFIRQY